jgi:hypothetical protein
MLSDKIFTANGDNFNSIALEVFQFQYQNNAIYRQYCNSLKIDSQKIIGIQQIPFLPIQFFKTHKITTTDFEAEAIFESSGTTQTINSKHFVKALMKPSGYFMATLLIGVLLHCFPPTWKEIIRRW